MPPAPPVSSRAWLTANLLLQLAYGLLAMTICLPSLPGWAQEFGATQSHVQLSFSAFVAAYGGLQLIYGPVSDRLGRKPVLLFGLALAGLGSLLGVFASDLNTVIAARALQGAGSAAGMVVGRALVQDLFQGRERPRMMAYIGMTMGLCPPLATLIGGQVHEHFTHVEGEEIQLRRVPVRSITLADGSTAKVASVFDLMAANITDCP